VSPKGKDAIDQETLQRVNIARTLLLNDESRAGYIKALEMYNVNDGNGTGIQEIEPEEGTKVEEVSPNDIQIVEESNLKDNKSSKKTVRAVYRSIILLMIIFAIAAGTGSIVYYLTTSGQEPVKKTPEPTVTESDEITPESSVPETISETSEVLVTETTEEILEEPTCWFGPDYRRF